MLNKIYAYSAKKLLIFLVAFSIISCTSQKSEEPGADSQQDTTSFADWQDNTDNVHGNRIMEIIEIGYSMGETEAEIHANFGPPDDVALSETKNRHTGETDKILHLKYPGLEFELYRVSDSGKELLMSTILTNRQISQRLPFQIGATKAEIENYLGEPTQTATPNQNTEILQYETPGMGASSYLLLHFSGNLLQEVEWDYYVD